MRIGAAIRYRRADLEEWIARQMQVQGQMQARKLPPPTILSAEDPVKRGRGRPRKTGTRAL